MSSSLFGPQVRSRLVVTLGMIALGHSAAWTRQAPVPSGPALLAKAEPAEGPKELLARAPFDRITLIDDSAWEIEPLSPRPLPPFDPKKIRSRVNRGLDQLPGEGNIGVPGRVVEMPKTKDEEDAANFLEIHTLQGDVRDYKVRREHIKAIAYFEDLLIAEAGRLVVAGEFARAFEYLLFVKSRQANWPGLAEGVDRLLFEEGSRALLDGDGERGLRLLGELQRRRPDYPGLGDKLAQSFAARIDRAIAAGAFASGRALLHELQGIAPGHPVVAELRGRF